MINNLLKNIGLNDKEIEVYLALLKNGRISPADLAKEVNINRTTVYSVVKELIKKGLAVKDLGSAAHFLTAADPKDLLNLIHKEEKELALKKDLTEKAIKGLSSLNLKTGPSIPRIRFVEENKIERYLYEQTDKWNESIKKYDGIWWGFQDEKFARLYLKWAIDYWDFPSSKGIGSRGLTGQHPAEDAMQKKRRAGKGKQVLERFGRIYGDVMDRRRPHNLLRDREASLLLSRYA